MIVYDDEYIVAVSNDDVRYDEIMGKSAMRPTAPEGYEYRLRADTLEWEMCEIPPAPTDEDITADEALDIITGGTI